MTFTRALSTNNYGPAKFIVDASAANGTHSTINAAITSASSGDTIFIRPGTYIENLTLKAGVNLTAFESDSSLNATGKVIISGTCTMTTAGSVTISSVQLQTNGAALLAVTGNAASIVNINNCYLNMTNSTGITYSSSSATSAINLSYCKGNLGTTGIALYANSSTGTLTIEKSNFSNTGASTTASTTSAGSVQLYFNNFGIVFSTSSAASMAMFKCVCDTSGINTTIITTAGTGGATISHCYFASGTASALSAGSGTTINATLCTVNSTNTNTITGAGTATLTGICYTGTSSKTNVTTQTGGAVNGLTQGSAPSAGMIGEQIRALGTNVAITTGSQVNIASISLTPGIWDISGMAQFTGIVTGSNSALSISATSATLSNVNGDDIAQCTIISQVGGSTITLSIPSFRVTLSAAATRYLVGFAVFTVGACATNGRISATRVG